jgi:predicted RNA-binding Zn-ribbon protein involved in translation (DUF1610 family)
MRDTLKENRALKTSLDTYRHPRGPGAGTGLMDEDEATLVAEIKTLKASRDKAYNIMNAERAVQEAKEEDEAARAHLASFQHPRGPGAGTGLMDEDEAEALNNMAERLLSALVEVADTCDNNTNPDDAGAWTDEVFDATNRLIADAKKMGIRCLSFPDDRLTWTLEIDPTATFAGKVYRIQTVYVQDGSPAPAHKLPLQRLTVEHSTPAGKAEEDLGVFFSIDAAKRRAHDAYQQHKEASSVEVTVAWRICPDCGNGNREDEYTMHQSGEISCPDCNHKGPVDSFAVM